MQQASIMANINLKQSEAFVAVAHHLSFRRAAQVLNTTQPNTSARISALEAQLGQSLMERDAGSVRLSPQGGYLLEKACIVLASVDNFMLAADSPELFTGTLRLGVTEIVVHSWLPKFLSSFQAQFPNIEVDLTVDLSSHLSRLLHDHNLDLALHNGPFDTPISGMKDLDEYGLAWVGASHLKDPDNILNNSDLSQFPIFTYAKETLLYQQLVAHFDQCGKTNIRYVSSTRVSACVRMTIEGHGIACLPKIMVEDDLQSGRLIPLQYSWTPDPLKFYARYDAIKAQHFVRTAAELAHYASLHEL